MRGIFDQCHAAVGGDSNEDVYHYLHDRPKVITRQAFFERVTWTIWVSGKSRRAARVFLDRAEESGFPNEFNTVASWGKQERDNFMVECHGDPIPLRAEQMWSTIFRVAQELNSFPSEDSFRVKYFGGKDRTADLDKSDIKRLICMKIPFVGPANAHYIVRGMGGEAIKCDRWIKEYLDWYPITLNGLESELQSLSIPHGLFDLVTWCYCEMFVGKVERFNNHFDKKFP